MDHQNNIPQMPLGLGMAMSMNPEAMKYFASLSEEEQAAVIAHVHTIQSRDEMHAYVNALGRHEKGSYESN